MQYAREKRMYFELAILLPGEVEEGSNGHWHREEIHKASVDILSLAHSQFAGTIQGHLLK